MKKYHLIFTLLLLFFGFNSTAQNFINGDLEGDFDRSAELPLNWQNVFYLDPACHAIASYQATPDLTSETGPYVLEGIIGKPKSGETFVSGLIAGPGLHHEGIQQELTNLIPGICYRVHLHQTIVKQENCLDTSGAWAIYRDEKLIGITRISKSQLEYDSLDLQWDERSVEFKATQMSHVIKFLPWDDDNVFNENEHDGYLRMGIDNISLEELVDFEIIDDIELTVYPNPSSGYFQLKTKAEDFELTILDVAGKVILKRSHCNDLTKVDLNLSGLFIVMIRTEFKYSTAQIVIL